jgi:uncharacterized membrane protein
VDISIGANRGLAEDVLRISKTKFALLVAMSLVGLAASTYVFIIYNSLRQLPLGCPIKPTGWIDCAAVLSSGYSEVFGIPLELFAIGYFVVSLVLVYIIVFGRDTFYHHSFRALFFWRFVGVPLVLYLIGIEVFVIHAICIYCTIMHAAIFTDFGIVTYFFYTSRGFSIAPVARKFGPDSESEH